jgi:hypothetical protein
MIVDGNANHPEKDAIVTIVLEKAKRPTAEPARAAHETRVAFNITFSMRDAP